MKKEIRIDELRALMLDALTLRGIGSEDADFIVDDFLDAELAVAVDLGVAAGPAHDFDAALAA